MAILAIRSFDHALAQTGLSDSAIAASAELLLWSFRAVSMRRNVPLSPAAAAAFQISDTHPCATLQEACVLKLAALLAASPAEKGAVSQDMRCAQLSLASKMHILTSEAGIALTQSVCEGACNSALFWKQKLFTRLFTQTVASSPAAQLSTTAILAACSLAQSVPANILQDRLALMVEIVVQALARMEHISVTEGNIATLLSVQSMSTLQTLLEADAQVFVPFLNIVVPAVLQVWRRCAHFLHACMFFPKSFFSLRRRNFSVSLCFAPMFPPPTGLTQSIIGQDASGGAHGSAVHNRAHPLRSVVSVQGAG